MPIPPDPPDPCLELRNALDAALVEFDLALLLVQERTEALQDCIDQHSGLQAKADGDCDCDKMLEWWAAALHYMQSLRQGWNP